MRSWVIPAALSLVAACGGGQNAPDPWLAPKAETLGRVHTIGVAPLTIPIPFTDSLRVRATFDTLLAAELRSEGLTVVMLPDFQRVADSQRREHGLFDPATGQLDSTRAELVARHTFQQLASEYQADAWLAVELVVVPARVEGWDAYWDGTRQGIASIWEKLGGAYKYGTVPAYSLCARMMDSTGKVLFHHHGGIELAPREDKDIPVAKQFVDPKRNAKAAKVALDPLRSPS